MSANIFFIQWLRGHTGLRDNTCELSDSCILWPVNHKNCEKIKIKGREDFNNCILLEFVDVTQFILERTTVTAAPVGLLILRSIKTHGKRGNSRIATSLAAMCTCGTYIICTVRYYGRRSPFC